MSLVRSYRKLTVLQLALLAGTSVIFYALHGVWPAASVWFGGLIAVVNIALLQWRRNQAARGRALSAGQSIRLLYRSALERFLVVVVLFVLGVGIMRCDAFALLTGFIVGQLALFFIGNERISERHGA